MKNFKTFFTENYIVQYKKDGEQEFTTLAVSDRQFDRAAKWLKLSDEQLDLAAEHIEKVGLKKSDAQQILSIITKYGEVEKVFELFQSPISMDAFLNCGNIINYFNTNYGFSPELTVDLLNYQPSTQPVTGKAEAFIQLFVQGARKGRVGDIVANGETFEIKTSGARLRGQKGYGVGIAAAKVFASELQKLANKANFDNTFDVKSLNFNITKEQNGAIDQVAPELTATGKVTKHDIATVYVQGFKQVYLNATDEELYAWILPHLNPAGTITEDFKTQYFLFALRYYSQQEDFGTLVSISTSSSPKALQGKIQALKKENIMSGQGVTSKIKPDGWPGFSASAGPQGAFFAIRPAL